MVLLRATKRVLRTLGETESGDSSSDTALGDWYVNRVVVDRQPLLLMVSSKSLLAIIEPGRNVRTLPDRVFGIIERRLVRLGVPPRLISREVQVMRDVRVGRTRDRSVTGTLVDFAKALPYYLPTDGWNEEDLRLAEDRLGETPCRCSRPARETIWPATTAVELLAEHWQVPRIVH